MPSFQTHPFDPQTASAEVWSAYHVFRRTIAAELWPDDPVLSDDEVRAFWVAPSGWGGPSARCSG